MTNPYTERNEFDLPLLGKGDVDAVVCGARRAFEDWQRESVSARVALCERFIASFEAAGEEIARDTTRQMGKPLRQARNEVAGTLDRARYMNSIAERALADEALPVCQTKISQPGPTMTIK